MNKSELLVLYLINVNLYFHIRIKCRYGTYRVDFMHRRSKGSILIKQTIFKPGIYKIPKIINISISSITS